MARLSRALSSTGFRLAYVDFLHPNGAIFGTTGEVAKRLAPVHLADSSLSALRYDYLVFAGGFAVVLIDGAVQQKDVVRVLLEGAAFAKQLLIVPGQAPNWPR